MYIVNRGKLHVVGDNNKTVLATLKAGIILKKNIYFILSLQKKFQTCCDFLC